MAVLNLLDIAKLKNTDPIVGMIEEAAKSNIEIETFATRPISGTSYKTKVRTGLPTTSFRAANEGTSLSKSSFEQRLTECFVIDPIIQIDKAVADDDPDGPEACMAMETVGHLESVLQLICTQIYSGVSAGDAKGFPGFADLIHADMIEPAGGSTAKTSAWLVRSGLRDVHFVFGRDGQITTSDMVEGVALDTNGKSYPVYRVTISARIGLGIESIYSVCQIKDIGTDTDKGLTDALIAKALSRFPAGKGPTALYCGRRSLQQLQGSRTATNTTGAPAPFPEDSFGVPIKSTDALTY